jgi:hypothetical protein
MLDGDAVVEALRTRAQVQLWGHLHSQNLAVVDGNVHLNAGAVHPERGRTDWEPRYNVFEISIDPGRPATATVVVLPRVYSNESHAFGPDAAGTQAYTVPFDEPPVVGHPVEEEQGVTQPVSEPLRDARRQLAFAFSSLAYQHRLSVARELGLLDPAARDLPDQRLFEVILGRALEENRLADLWSTVRRARGEDPAPNPFVAASPGDSGQRT